MYEQGVSEGFELGVDAELARACMARADDALKLPEVRAFAHPETSRPSAC